jgi:hypothetical protein
MRGVLVFIKKGNDFGTKQKKRKKASVHRITSISAAQKKGEENKDEKESPRQARSPNL